MLISDELIYISKIYILKLLIDFSRHIMKNNINYSETVIMKLREYIIMSSNKFMVYIYISIKYSPAIGGKHYQRTLCIGESRSTVS